MSEKFNRNIQLNSIQKQVILSGILGDGNLKRNGKNYYYRESHSSKEKEYCYFKYNILKPYISKSGFHIVDNRDGQFGFQTINATNLSKYKYMNKIDIINKLNKFGLILYILDDGWINYKSYNLCTGILNNDQIDVLTNAYNTQFNITTKIINNQHKAISFVNCMENILPYCIQYIPHNIDIYIHKIFPLLSKFKV